MKGTVNPSGFVHNRKLVQCHGPREQGNSENRSYDDDFTQPMCKCLLFGMVSGNHLSSRCFLHILIKLWTKTTDLDRSWLSRRTTPDRTQCLIVRKQVLPALSVGRHIDPKTCLCVVKLGNIYQVQIALEHKPFPGFRSQYPHRRHRHIL